jgi:hypothetical protein
MALIYIKSCGVTKWSQRYKYSRDGREGPVSNSLACFYFLKLQKSGCNL